MVVTNFLVKKRKISQIDSVPYTGEDNIDTFKFEFDEEWEGLDKTLVIVSGNNRYNIALLHDQCVVPFEFYQIKGNVLIGLFGTNGTYQTLATGWLPIYVEEDSYEVGVEPDNLPTQTQWDAFVTEINNLLEQAEASEDHCAEILEQIEELKSTIESYKSTIEGYKDTTKGYMDTTEGYKNDTKQYMDTTEGYKNDVNTTIANFNNNVEQKTTDFNNNATQKTDTFNNNATSKTNAFNQNASDKTTAFNNNYTEKVGIIDGKASDFNTNYDNKLGSFNSNASDKTTAFNDNATSKTNDFNTNATNKTNSFNSNATDKTDTFNTNATNKTTAFDNNATSKTNTFNQNAADKTTAFNENYTAKLNAFNENAESFDERLDELELIKTNIDTATTEPSSNIHLTDSLNGYNEGIAVKGNTTQETTTGKNKFNVNSLEQGGLANADGSETTNEYMVRTPHISVTGGSDYTFQIEYLSNRSFNYKIYQYSSSYTFISVSSEFDNASKTIALDSNTSYIRIRIYEDSKVSPSNFNTLFKNVQLEQGSTATSYEPYTGGQPSPSPAYPQNIVDTTGTQTIYNSNKNLFDLDWVVYRTTNGITATKGEDCIVLNGTATASAYINFVFPSNITSIIDTTLHTWFCLTTQTISKIQFQRDSGGVVNILNPTTLTKNTFGNTLTGGYIEIASGTTLNNCKVYIDARKGILTFDNYEFAPHKGQNITLHLGDIYLGDLNGAENLLFKNVESSDYYDSELEYGAWYWQKAINKITLDGSSSVSLYSSYNNINQLVISVDNTIKPKYFAASYVSGSVICTHFDGYISYNKYWTKADTILASIENMFSIQTTMSLAEFKTWLSTHNIDIYYILATPINLKITDTDLLSDLTALEKTQTYKGGTVISVTPTTGNPAILEVTYLKDPLIALEARIALLED